MVSRKVQLRLFCAKFQVEFKNIGVYVSQTALFYYIYRWRKRSGRSKGKYDRWYAWHGHRNENENVIPPTEKIGARYRMWRVYGRYKRTMAIWNDDVSIFSRKRNAIGGNGENHHRRESFLIDTIDEKFHDSLSRKKVDRRMWAKNKSALFAPWMSFPIVVYTV